MNYNEVGKPMLRTDAYEKVTGGATYVADIKLPKMLYAKILRAEHAHSKIISIDTSEAEKMPGVRKVVTGQGCAILFGACIKDQPPLAVDKVRHAGEGVAAVIAESEKQAEEATKKAKKEIREAEEATGKAQEEVIEAAEVTIGKKKKKLTQAAHNLEKAVCSAGESSEATEEAEFKVQESKK